MIVLHHVRITSGADTGLTSPFRSVSAANDYVRELRVTGQMFTTATSQHER